MSHYFIEDKDLKDDIKTINTYINDTNYKFITNSGVFSKDYLDFGSKLLIESVIVNENHLQIADIGCGYGPIGIILAKNNPNSHVSMFDINQKAINLAIENAKLNNVENVLIKQNNILENINKKFDLIVSNPPIRAGKDTVFNIYEQSYNSLNEGGELYVVIQRKQGAPSSVKKLEELFTNVSVVTKFKGYWILKAIK